MKSFTLRIYDASHMEEIADVQSFVGEDASGSFGILAGHGRMITSLVIGLARFRIGENSWQYLALPGALLYFKDEALTLTTQKYIRDDDYMRISSALQEQILKDEEQLQSVKGSLRRMEQELFKRLWDMSRAGTS